jgi:hypothetical protein
VKTRKISIFAAGRNKTGSPFTIFELTMFRRYENEGKRPIPDIWVIRRNFSCWGLTGRAGRFFDYRSDRRPALFDEFVLV